MKITCPSLVYSKIKEVVRVFTVIIDLNFNSTKTRQNKKSGTYRALTKTTDLISWTSKINTISRDTVPLKKKKLFS